MSRQRIGDAYHMEYSDNVVCPVRRPPNRDKLPYRLQSFDRAVAILEALSESETPISLAELCNRLPVHKSTAHRALMVLERSALIQRTNDNKFYLGLKLYRLGSRAIEQLDLRTSIRPYLYRLSNQTGETVHLGILQGASVVYLDKSQPSARTYMMSRMGNSNPAYCTSMGKAMLAFLPQETAEEIIRTIHFTRFTENTLCTRKDLVRSLACVRQRGYAIDDQEIEAGIRCVGAPVFDSNHVPIAAVSVSGSYAHIGADNLACISEQLLRCCTEISASLQVGHRSRSG